MTKAERIIAFCREQVGEPYDFGHAGPDSWDCSGLTKAAVKLIGYVWVHGATTQWLRGLGIRDKGCSDLPTWHSYWSDSGTIDTMPMNKMCFLFNQDKARTDKLVMAHTGVYDGRGNVIQAGGQYKGVSDKPINRKRWSHWATLKGADEVVTGASGAEVKTVQQQLINLGYSLGSYGADGKYGPVTEAAVKAFQADNGLTVNGEWTDKEQAKYNALIVKPPETVDKSALLNELKGIIDRAGAITKLL